MFFLVFVRFLVRGHFSSLILKIYIFSAYWLFLFIKYVFSYINHSEEPELDFVDFFQLSVFYCYLIFSFLWFCFALFAFPSFVLLYSFCFLLCWGFNPRPWDAMQTFTTVTTPSLLTAWVS